MILMDVNVLIYPHREDVRDHAAYRQWLEEHERFRAALQTGTPLGNDKFKGEIEAALGMRVGYARRGRPKAGVGL